MSGLYSMRNELAIPPRPGLSNFYKYRASLHCFSHRKLNFSTFWLEKDLGEFVLLVEERSFRAFQDNWSGSGRWWLLSDDQEKFGGLPPVEDVERWKHDSPNLDDLPAAQEECSAEPRSKRKTNVKSSRTQATSSRAKNVSPLNKKPKLPSAEKTQVVAIPASSAMVKHLVGADSKKIGGMCNIRDVPLKPLADEFRDHDLLCEVVRARSSSLIEKQKGAYAHL
ncbi:unnamed protein product [Prunus armeniaca]